MSLIRNGIFSLCLSQNLLMSTSIVISFNVFSVGDPSSSCRNPPPTTLDLKKKFKFGGNMIGEDK